MATEKNTTTKKSPAKKAEKNSTKSGAKRKPTVTVTADKTTEEFDKQLRKVRRTAADRRELVNRKSIARRTAAFRSCNWPRILSLLALIPLAGISFLFTAVIQGYSFSALVAMCLMGIILFYNIMPLIGKKFPVFSKVVTRIFTIILCIGLLIVGITEALIIRASFGSPNEEVHYMVVLGAKVRADGPSVSLQNRIDAAYDYLTKYPDSIAVVSGGKGPDEPITEAQCMYDCLTKRGIDPSRIWMEDQATSTWENLHFSLDLIEEKTGIRPEKLAVLSSEYHLFRAGLFTEACGVEFVGIPAHTTRLSQMINHFMREVAGVWHYILLGSLGGKYHA